MTTPRLLLFTTALEQANGPGVVMTNLAVQLKKLGFDISLLSTHGPHSSDVIDTARSAGIEVRHLSMRKLYDPAGAPRFVRVVKELRPDLVHTRNIRADVIGRLAKRYGARVVNNVVNQYPNESLKMHGPVLGRIVLTTARATRKPVDLYVANSNAIVPGVVATFRVAPSRLRVIHDGVDIARWGPGETADLTPLGIDPKDKVCITTARLDPQKDIAALVEAAAHVARERDDVRFVVAGEGSLRPQLEARIAALGLEKTVFLVGWRPDVAELLRRANLYVFPSRFEGLPSSVIEALAAGVPVVASAVSGVPELIEEGVTGWLVEPGSPAELATAILDALGSELAEVGAAAKRAAEERFSSAAMARSFAEVYAELGVVL